MAGILDLIRQERTRRLTERAQVAADAQVSVQQRLAEQAQAQDAAEQQRLAQERIAALRPLLGKFGAATAGQLGPAIASTDPNAAALGLQTLTGLVGQLDPAYKSQVATQQEALAAEQQARPTRLALLREQLTGQQLANTAQARQNRVNALADAAPIPALPFGTPPKGYFPVARPDTGTVEYIPQPGTEPYNKAQSTVDLLGETIRRVQRFQVLVDQAGASGTEYSGPVATQLAAERGTILSAVAQLRNLGVLQPGEYELLDSQFPDPTSFSANVSAALSALDPTGSLLDRKRSTIQAPYSQLRQDFEQRLRKARSTFWYVRHDAGMLPEDARPEGRY